MCLPIIASGGQTQVTVRGVLRSSETFCVIFIPTTFRTGASISMRSL